MKLDGRTAAKDSGRKDSEEIVNLLNFRRDIKDGRKTDEAVGKYPIIFGNKGSDEELVSLLDRGNTLESQFVNEAVLEGLIGTFYDAFRLRNAGSFELDAKFAGRRNLN